MMAWPVSLGLVGWPKARRHLVEGSLEVIHDLAALRRSEVVHLRGAGDALQPVLGIAAAEEVCELCKVLVCDALALR